MTWRPNFKLQFFRVSAPMPAGPGRDGQAATPAAGAGDDFAYTHAPAARQAAWQVAVGQTIVLLHPALPPVGVSTAAQRRCSTMTASPKQKAAFDWLRGMPPPAHRPLVRDLTNMDYNPTRWP